MPNYARQVVLTPSLPSRVGINISVVVTQQLVLTPSLHSPVGITISVIVTQQVVLPHLFVPSNLERLVHRGEQILAEVGHQINQIRKVLLDLLGRQPPHQIQSTIQLLLCHSPLTKDKKNLL